MVFSLADCRAFLSCGHILDLHSLLLCKDGSSIRPDDEFSLYFNFSLLCRGNSP